MSGVFSLNEEEWLQMKDIATSNYLKKGELILSEGTKNDKEYFIEKGIVRGFKTDDKGNEKSVAFFEEGEFMSTSALRIKNGLSVYSYQAMCPTILLTFDSKALKTHLSQNRHLSEFGKRIKEREIERLSKRDDCLLHVHAADRYAELLKYYPKLERYISQKYIASYIGITPVSLSRIKNK